MSDTRVIPLGDSAFIVRLSSKLDREVNLRARAIADAIEAASLAGLTDVVPANSSVGVYFDLPEHAQGAASTLAELLETRSSIDRAAQPELHSVAVSYNGADLAEIAAACGLSAQQVVDIHCAAEYQVFAMGFAPGFAYMGEVDERISVARRTQPRTLVPAGSVAIANRQTAIYPFETPGGWNIVGTTTLRPFDIHRRAAALFNVGDRVRFVPS